METIFTNEIYGWLPSAIVYLLNAIVIFYLGKWLLRRAYPNIDLSEELVVKDNLAFAIANVGYYAGLLAVIGGSLIGESQGIGMDIVNQLVYGILAVGLLFLSGKINDRFILHEFSIYKEIFKDRNEGTGVVEAASYLAAGLIIYGAVSGGIHNMFPDLEWGLLISGVLSVLVFWAIGQLLLVATTRIYCRFIPYNVHQKIREDNVAAGVSFAGAIVALGILISYGVGGDFYGWGDHFLKIGVDVLVGLALLPIMRWVTDTVLLPGEKLTDEIANQEHPNVGAALIEAFAYIGGAILITLCI